MTSKYLLGIIKILIFSIIAVAATYIFLTLFNGNQFPFSLPERKDPNIVLQNIVLDETITSVDLEWYAGGVEITKSADNKIHLVEKSSVQLDENRWVKPVVNGDTLVLHSRNKYNFVFFFFQSPESYLELQLPDQVYESMRVYVTSGIYSISDFEISNFNLNMTSGNLHVNNFKSDEIKVTMTSGDAFFINADTNRFDINMTSGNTSFNGSISDDCNIEMTSGNLDLDTSIDSPRQLSVDMTSGNANITLSDEEGFQISLDKTSGNFNPDSKLTRLNDSLYQYLDFKLSYSVEMTSGSLGINVR